MNALTALAFFLFLVPAISRPDFSGTWILDVNRSRVSTAPESPLRQETLIVMQTETELLIERHSTTTTTHTIRLDGVTGVPGSTARVRPVWFGRMLCLMVESPSTPEQWFWRTDSLSFSPVSSNLRWSLSPDGKVLTLAGTTTPRVEDLAGKRATEKIAARWVYRKQ